MCTCVCMHACACVCADPPEMYDQCVHTLVHKWSDTWHPKVSPLWTNTTCFFSPSLPLPAGLAAPPQVSSPSFEPIPAFFQFSGHCSPPASSAATGMQQTLPLHRAAPGTVLCSRAIAKSRLCKRQQLLINFQRWNLWHKLLKLWFKSMVKSRRGRDRNLIHPSQLPLSGVAA